MNKLSNIMLFTMISFFTIFCGTPKDSSNIKFDKQITESLKKYDYKVEIISGADFITQKEVSFKNYPIAESPTSKPDAFNLLRYFKQNNFSLLDIKPKYELLSNNYKYVFIEAIFNLYPKYFHDNADFFLTELSILENQIEKYNLKNYYILKILGKNSKINSEYIINEFSKLDKISMSSTIQRFITSNINNSEVYNIVEYIVEKRGEEGCLNYLRNEFLVIPSNTSLKKLYSDLLFKHLIKKGFDNPILITHDLLKWLTEDQLIKLCIEKKKEVLLQKSLTQVYFVRLHHEQFKYFPIQETLDLLKPLEINRKIVYLSSLINLRDDLTTVQKNSIFNNLVLQSKKEKINSIDEWLINIVQKTSKINSFSELIKIFPNTKIQDYYLPYLESLFISKLKTQLDYIKFANYSNTFPKKIHFDKNKITFFEDYSYEYHPSSGYSELVILEQNNLLISFGQISDTAIDYISILDNSLKNLRSKFSLNFDYYLERTWNEENISVYKIYLKLGKHLHEIKIQNNLYDELAIKNLVNKSLIEYGIKERLYYSGSDCYYVEPERYIKFAKILGIYQQSEN